MEAVMTFYFSRPKHHYRTGKFAGVIKEKQDVWHSKKKDLDNLVKFVLDSLNALAYVDDGQICSLKAAKFYATGGDNPRSEIVLRQLPLTKASISANNVAVVVEENKKVKKEKTVTIPIVKASKKGRAIKKESSTASATVIDTATEGGGRGHADIFACSS
jgi:hypothetical protein